MRQIERYDPLAELARTTEIQTTSTTEIPTYTMPSTLTYETSRIGPFTVVSSTSFSTTRSVTKDESSPLSFWRTWSASNTDARSTITTPSRSILRNSTSTSAFSTSSPTPVISTTSFLSKDKKLVIVSTVSGVVGAFFYRGTGRNNAYTEEKEEEMGSSHNKETKVEENDGRKARECEVASVIGMTAFNVLFSISHCLKARLYTQYPILFIPLTKGLFSQYSPEHSLDISGLPGRRSKGPCHSKRRPRSVLLWWHWPHTGRWHVISQGKAADKALPTQHIRTGG
jgi:hypothetical protein